MPIDREDFARRLRGARQAHRWDVAPKAGIRLQVELRARVIQTPLNNSQLRYVAGIDVGFPRGKAVARAAVVVLAYPSLEIVEQVSAERPVEFPYVPGLLSFREIPVILQALEKLSQPPDVFVTDGHGLAHPRRFGLACHLGVLLEMPVLGCAKSILVGDHAPLDETRGSTTPLQIEEEAIGMVVRTRDRVRPVYISIGHRIDLASAVEITLACGGGYRLPEPTRQAHRYASVINS